MHVCMCVRECVGACVSKHKHVQGACEYLCAHDEDHVPTDARANYQMQMWGVAFHCLRSFSNCNSMCY